MELVQDTALRSLPTGGSVFGGLGLDTSVHGVVIGAAPAIPELSRMAVGTAAQHAIAIEAISSIRNRPRVRLILLNGAGLGNPLTEDFIVPTPGVCVSCAATTSGSAITPCNE